MEVVNVKYLHLITVILLGFTVIINSTPKQHRYSNNKCLYLLKITLSNFVIVDKVLENIKLKIFVVHNKLSKYYTQ